MKVTNMQKCEKCGGSGIIHKDGAKLSCPICLSPEAFEKAIQKAIAKCRRNDNNDKLADLIAVESFLPSFPVMAVMEAEARCLNKDFVLMLKQSFEVRSFGDQSYVGETITKG